MSTVIHPIAGEVPLSILTRCDGYYECPKDNDGKRLGPLVGYAGRDSEKKQFVGDVYVNFAKGERHGPVLKHVATKLAEKLAVTLQHSPCTGFCGAPEGGKALAVTLAIVLELQYIFPEKKVTAVGTDTSREVSELRWGRHQPEKGERWLIVEDVCNNFSTTASLFTLIQSCGAEVAGIVCFLNRSIDIDHTFYGLPVLRLVRKPISEYRQGDVAVAADIQAGNVIWKPKDGWAELMAAMGC